MGFDNVRFPVDVALGATGGPGFKTQIIELRSGSEERISRWETPRHQYDVAKGIDSHETLFATKRFFMGRRGAAQTFRFKDWSDYATNASGTTYFPTDVATTALDQKLKNTVTGILGKGDGTTKVFQMIREYDDDVANFLRVVVLPVQSTILVAVAGATQTETTHYSVNYVTGEVTFVTAPGLNVDVEWGGEYDVKTRFDVTTDEWLSCTIEDFSSSRIPSVKLVEEPDGVPVPDRFWAGGVKDHGSVSVDVAANLSEGRVQRVNPLNAGRAIVLQRADDLPRGAPIFYVQNASATQTLAVKLTNGTTLTTLAALGITEIGLSDDGTGVKTLIAIT